MLLRPIDALLPRASRSFGGKAQNLAALVRAGFPVPAAYALSSEAATQHFARALPHALRPEQLLSRPSASERDLEEATARVLETPLDATLEHELRRAFEALRAASVQGVAVRASSASDDEAAVSAAELHISVLNVTRDAALFEAVRRCYAQVFSFRVVSYLRSVGLPAVAEMGVVIQAMVPADVAGVLFTVNPLTGDPEEMVIDAGYGLGTHVADGRTAHDTYRIHKHSGWVRDRVIGDKRVRVVLGASGGLQQEPVPAALAHKQVLDEHMLSQLVALGRRVEEHFGDARDLEFAIAADSLYLLQARAVTQAPVRHARARGRRRPQLDAGASSVVWSNLRVREALSGVATPLTWSVLSEPTELGFRAAFAALGCKVPKDLRLLGNFRGRIYLNSSGISQIAAQVPGLKTSLLLEPGGDIEAERVERGGKRASPAGFLLRLPWTAARFTRANLGLGERAAELEQTFAAEHQRIAALDFRILAASALDETLSDVQRLLNQASTQLLTAYGGFLAALVPLRAALQLLKGGQASRVQDALLSAIEDAESAAPGPELLRIVAAFERDVLASAQLRSAAVGGSVEALPDGEAKRAVETFLRQHGHRGLREAELTEPRWREGPQQLLQTVRAELEGVCAGGPSVAQRIADVHAAADAAMASIALPLRSPVRAALSVVRSYVRLRARSRSQVVHVFGALRLVALDASRRLAVREPGIGPDAAFFLTLDELHGVLRGEIRAVAALVRMRRAQYERDRSLPDPPDTFVGYPPPPAVVVRVMEADQRSTGASAPVRAVQRLRS
jgi:hypothetical protein